MYILVFDTTANGVAIGLYRDRERLFLSEKVEEFGQAEDLAVGVSELLQKAHITFKDVELVGVCTGPGSFTGVRASLAFARGLAIGAPEIKITGVSAFEIYAKMLKESDRAYYNAVVIETKREDFYFQLFDADMRKISQPAALEREVILRQLKGHQVSFIGDGVERLLSEPSGLQLKTVELSTMVDAQALFEAVYQKYLNKTLDFPKPLYIRGCDVCVK